VVLVGGPSERTPREIYRERESCDLCGHLEPVIGPTSQFQYACLNVVRKIFDIDRAGRFINGGWLPHDQPVVVDRGLGH
jgi:hypothetical protein